jgi:hypothetical protein
MFDGHKQKAEINLINIGTDTSTYSISFRQYYMTEQGNLNLIEKNDTSKMFADQFLRIFPRQVTLAPQESQVVRLQLRRTKNITPGEYRSHLWFRSEKNYEALGSEETPLLDSNQLSVTVFAIFGMTIPVIIREGVVSVSTNLSDLKYEIPPDSIPTLKLAINRTGNISGYGNLIVEYFPAEGKSYIVGAVNGIGVYTNLIKRYVSIKLNKIPGMILKNGKLKVIYTSPDDSKKYEIYCDGELDLK